MLLLIALLALTLVATFVVTDVRRAIFRTVLPLVRPIRHRTGDLQPRCFTIGALVPPLVRVEGG